MFYSFWMWINLGFGGFFDPFGILLVALNWVIYEHVRTNDWWKE
jgi:hypothetical protein